MTLTRGVGGTIYEIPVAVLLLVHGRFLKATGLVKQDGVTNEKVLIMDTSRDQCSLHTQQENHQIALWTESSNHLSQSNHSRRRSKHHVPNDSKSLKDWESS